MLLTTLAPHDYPQEYVSSYIFKLENTCWIFSNLYIPPCVGKFFESYGVHIPTKCIEIMHNWWPPSPPPPFHSKFQAEFFENLLPPTAKRVEKTIICFIKIQSENMNVNWNIRLLIFCMICNFSKCYGFVK